MACRVSQGKTEGTTHPSPGRTYARAAPPGLSAEQLRSIGSRGVVLDDWLLVRLPSDTTFLRFVQRTDTMSWRSPYEITEKNSSKRKIVLTGAVLTSTPEIQKQFRIHSYKDDYLGYCLRTRYAWHRRIKSVLAHNQVSWTSDRYTIANSHCTRRSCQKRSAMILICAYNSLFGKVWAKPVPTQSKLQSNSKLLYISREQVAHAKARCFATVTASTALVTEQTSSAIYAQLFERSYNERLPNRGLLQCYFDRVDRSVWAESRTTLTFCWMLFKDLKRGCEEMCATLIKPPDTPRAMTRWRSL